MVCTAELNTTLTVTKIDTGRRMAATPASNSNKPEYPKQNFILSLLHFSPNCFSVRLFNAIHNSLFLKLIIPVYPIKERKQAFNKLLH